MKVLMVIPRYNLTDKPNYNYAFPLGLAYIFTSIYNSKHDIDCLNLNHLYGTTEDLIREALDKKNYDIVCTGHMGLGYSIVEKITKFSQSHNSNPKIILGGSLMTSEPTLMFNTLNPDYAILGEGDITIVELLDAIENNKNNLKNIDGIMYKQEGKVITTKPREVIENLDSLPFPRIDEFGFREFLDNQDNKTNFSITDYPRPYIILCSRGCPYQCTFCYHSIGTKYRERSLDNIFTEIEIAIRKYEINSLLLLDDLFSVNKKRVYEFCERIMDLNRRLKKNIGWSCQLSVNNVDRELLKVIKRAGCNIVSFGFESYSPNVLKSMKKPITPQQIDNAIKLTSEAGLGIQGAFIFGDTAETKETAKETLDYWKKNCQGQIRLFFIQPYPGSEIYKRSIEKGIIKDKLDFIQNKMNHTTWFNMTLNMSDKEILELKKDILDARRKYYPYAFPLKVKKIKNDRYEVEIKCPFCKKIINYKNCSIEKRFYFTHLVACKNCYKRINIVNKPYKFTMDYYNQLDFIRRGYLYLRDNFLKKKI